MWTLNVAETASRPLVAPHAHALNSTYAWRKTRGRGQTKPLKAIYADSLVQGACMKWHAGFLTDYLKCHASFVMSWHTWEVSELPLSKANYHYLSEEILFYFRGGGWLHFKTKGCNIPAGEYSLSFVVTGRLEDWRKNVTNLNHIPIAFSSPVRILFVLNYD